MDIIVYVAKHDNNWCVRKSAIEEINDEKILKELLEDEEDFYCKNIIEDEIKKISIISENEYS